MKSQNKAMVFPVLLMVSSTYAVSAFAESIVLLGTEPFKSATATYLGTVLYDNYGYDLQPTVMYDPEDPLRKYKMWWLCRFPHSQWSESKDANPNTKGIGIGDQSDRICFSYSTDSNSWAPRQVVLKGAYGTSGANRGDDVMVGSPTVIRVKCGGGNEQPTCPSGVPSPGNVYVMFYEAYGSYITTINSFEGQSGGRLEKFATNGEIGGGSLPQDVPINYERKRVLGYAPWFKRYGTKPVYSCKVEYQPGKFNYFLQKDTPCPISKDQYGYNWSALNIADRYGRKESVPVLWLYTSAGPDRVELHRCWNPQRSDTFVSTSKSCDNDGQWEHSLGYASIGWRDDGSLATDMVGSNMNRVHMAYSLDGVSWTRFSADALDGSGAVVIPGDENEGINKNICDLNEEKYTFHSNYGVGYPSALVLNGKLELFVQDYSDPKKAGDATCNFPPKNDSVNYYVNQRIWVPLSKIFNPQTWRDQSIWTKRDRPAGGGSDIKWGGTCYKRYFATSVKNKNENGLQQWPTILWTDKNPAAGGTGTFSFQDDNQHSFDNNLPTYWDNGTNIRMGVWSAILGDVNGHLVNVTNHPYPHHALHLYYEAQNTGVGYSPFLLDIDHILVLAYNGVCD